MEAGAGIAPNNPREGWFPPEIGRRETPGQAEASAGTFAMMWRTDQLVLRRPPRSREHPADFASTLAGLVLATQ